jgi:hypothetical protein
VEEIAIMALQIMAANPKARPLSKVLRAKVFFRGHGGSGYYEQK